MCFEINDLEWRDICLKRIITKQKDSLLCNNIQDCVMRATCKIGVKEGDYTYNQEKRAEIKCKREGKQLTLDRKGIQTLMTDKDNVKTHSIEDESYVDIQTITS